MAKFDEFGNPIPDTQPNLFAQQKMQNYPTAATATQKAPGQAVGETVEQFAAGKQAANSSYNGTQQTIQPVQPLFPTPVVPQRQTYVPQQSIDPNSSTDGLDSVLGHFTSPQEEEKYRKASVARQRIMAVGDALRHIGNIYHTTRYAPSQKFNMPAEAERQRYLQEKSLRDQANQRIISYQQAKAAIDQKAKQWEADYGLKVADAARKAGATEAQIKNMQDKLAEQRRQYETTLAFNKEKEKNANDIKREQIKQSDINNRRTTGLGYANLALSKEKFKYLKEKAAGGSGNGGSPHDYATPNGTITMPRSFDQTQKDQVITRFDKYLNKSEIAKQMQEMGIDTTDPAQVRNYQFAKILQEHQDVADYVSEKFKGKQTFTSNPLERPDNTPQPMFQTPWGGAAFAGENPYSQYLMSNDANSGDEENIDYEQYLIQ